MTERTAVPAALSPQQLEQLWVAHLKGEFETKDVEATLETMVEDAYVNHVPVLTVRSRSCPSDSGSMAAR